MYDANWLYRGAQSALFYYVSCAPCHNYTATKKRQKQIERDRKAREIHNASNPEQYRQPSPYRTNEYWNEEISLGPGPPPKRASKKQRTERSKASGVSGSDSPALSGEHSSSDISALDTVKQKIHQAGERLNSKRYQREDEPLWGLSHLSPRPNLNHGSKTGFPGLAKHETARSSTETFYTAKAPPINDLHPPVVSNPSSNFQSNRWMLQPPPPASVMGGYERSNRSRSDSGTSSRRGGDIPLSRQVGEKILEKKVQNGESIPSTGSSREQKVADGEGQNHDRNGSPRPRSARSASYWAAQQSESSNKTSDTVIHRKPKAESELSQDTAEGETDATASPPDTPQLPVTATTDFAAPLPTPPPKAKVNRPPIFTKDSSLHILQELVSPTALLNSQLVARSPMEARIKLPATDSQEAFELGLMEHDIRLSRRPPWEDDYDDVWDSSERRTRWSIG